jgi:hypothetical protein
MTVTVYKMVSGEEVIAKSVDFDGVSHLVNRARVLRMVQTQQGPSFALVPWVISLADEEVTFMDVHVIVWKDAPSDMEKAYLEHTSGLQISQSLLG